MRPTLALLACAALSGCGVPSYNAPDAPLAEVSRRAYGDGGTTEVVLYTVLTSGEHKGAHTGLLIDGSQRVLWDPAGSFTHPLTPERGDVHYGMTPMMEKVFIDYHVRSTHDMMEQRLFVTPEQADRLIALVGEMGPASQATCAWTTSGLLRKVGVDVPQTFFPVALMNDFGELPGARSRLIDESNVDTNHNTIFAPAEPGRPGGA